MKSIRQINPIKMPLIVTAVVAAILVAYIVAAYFFQAWPFNTSSDSATNTPAKDSSTSTETSRDTDALNKKDFVEKTQSSANTPEPQPAPTESSTIKIMPTQQGSTITISTELQGYAAGACELTIANGEATYTDTADIIYQPQFSTCAGFSVPKANLGTGTWNITLRAIPDRSAAVTNSMTLEVK